MPSKITSICIAVLALRSTRRIMAGAFFSPATPTACILLSVRAYRYAALTRLFFVRIVRAAVKSITRGTFASRPFHRLNAPICLANLRAGKLRGFISFSLVEFIPVSPGVAPLITHHRPAGVASDLIHGRYSPGLFTVLLHAYPIVCRPA